MSQESVETLRAFLETWSREPWTLEAWQRGEVMDMSFVDPDVVYEDSVLPDHVGEAYRGHEGVLRAVEGWFEPAQWVVVEFEQIIDAGDRLVSIHKARTKARHTGIEIETPLVYLWTLRDGKVVHFRAFVDVEQALEVAGLRES
jgi:ketosteroid isomerase-like protein